MNEPGDEGAEPVGSRVLMDCGHRLPLPWDVAPEVAVAELLHHRAICAAEEIPEHSLAISASYPGWLPIPGARR